MAPPKRTSNCSFLQCFDTVGLVIWPVKIVPDMTYTVFGGTLNLAQSINHKFTTHKHARNSWDLSFGPKSQFTQSRLWSWMSESPYEQIHSVTSMIPNSTCFRLTNACLTFCICPNKFNILSITFFTQYSLLSHFWRYFFHERATLRCTVA